MRKLKSVIAKSTERMFFSGDIYILKGKEYEVVSGDEDYFKIKDESGRPHVFDDECQYLFEFIYEGDQEKEETTRTFTIEKVYDIDDVDFMGDIQEIRLKENNTEVVRYRGEYMDTYYEIQGFLKALDYIGITYDVTMHNTNEAFR